MSRNKEKQGFEESIETKSKLRSSKALFTLALMVITGSMTYFTFQMNLHAQEKQHEAKVLHQQAKQRVLKSQLKNAKQKLIKIRLQIKEDSSQKRSLEFFIKGHKRFVTRMRLTTQKEERMLEQAKQNSNKTNIEKALALKKIGLIYAGVQTLSSTKKIQRAIYYLTKSSELVPSQRKYRWRKAVYQSYIANLYTFLYFNTPQNKLKNITGAIKNYKLSLTVLTKQANTIRWKFASYNLATSYHFLTKYRIQSLDTAIKSYRLSLTVFTKPKQTNKPKNYRYWLGNSYSQLLKSNIENRKALIFHYQRSLEFFTKKKSPKKWALATYRIARALTILSPNQKTSLERVKKLYKSILDVWTKSNHLLKWRIATLHAAFIEHQLAFIAPRKTPVQKQLLQRAFQLFDQVFPLLSSQQNPERWLRVSRSMLNINVELTRQERNPLRRKQLFIKSLRLATALSEFWKKKGNLKKRLRYLGKAAHIASNLLKNPMLTYKIFKTRMRIAPTANHQADLAEGTLHIGHFQESLQLAQKHIQQEKNPYTKVIMAHLIWQIYSLKQGIQAPQAKQSCQAFLQLYRKHWKRKYGWAFQAAHAFLQRQKSPHAHTIERSLVLFGGTYSCKHFQFQANLCQIQLPAGDPCAPSSR